jgi:hypothetical protein
MHALSMIESTMSCTDPNVQRRSKQLLRASLQEKDILQKGKGEKPIAIALVQIHPSGIL